MNASLITGLDGGPLGIAVLGSKLFVVSLVPEPSGIVLAVLSFLGLVGVSRWSF